MAARTPPARGGEGRGGRQGDGRGESRGGPRGPRPATRAVDRAGQRPGQHLAQRPPERGPGRQARGQAGRPSEPAGEQRDVHDPDGVRLQKVLASAGIGSRRACEVLIATGRVQVDGAVVREQGVRVDPQTAQVAVDGLLLQLDTSRVYLALNKPRGVVSTMHDPEGRKCLADFVAHRSERLFHVGRLDTETEGLVLLTNDGDLAHRLAHPSFEVPRTYLAEVDGPVARDVGRRLREGVELDDGPVRADSFRLVDSVPGRAVVEVVLHEGRKHVVRRMLAEVGHPVRRLVRTQLGSVHLGDLRPGSSRPLSRAELGQLRTPEVLGGDAGDR